MKKTILVVDDFASLRDFVREMLQRKGYETLGAANGNQAYAMLSDKTDVNLVLADYNIPDCSGSELLQRIKSNPETSRVPVVFLTTEGNPDKMRDAKEAGLSAWIKKPYRAETFFTHIENAIANG